MEQQGHLCLHKTSPVGRNSGCWEDLGFHSTGNRLEGLEQKPEVWRDKAEWKPDLVEVVGF